MHRKIPCLAARTAASARRSPHLLSIAILNLLDSTTNMPFFKRLESLDQYTYPRIRSPAAPPGSIGPGKQHNVSHDLVVGDLPVCLRRLAQGKRVVK